MGTSISQRDQPRSGSSLECSTTEGQLKIQAFGPEDGPVVLALHGMSSSPFIIREWDSLAEVLASSGFRVLLPNLHSNPAVAPSLLRAVDMTAVLLQVHQHFAANQQIVLMGKSWGGAIAAQFASQQPSIVQQLVLVCPAIMSLTKKKAMLKELKMPLLLLWARDDWVTWFSSSQVFRDHCPQILVKDAERGGHRILPEYTGSILSFLQT